jgi:plastocyanin
VVGLEEEEEDYGPGKLTTAIVVIVALGLALSVGAVLAFNLTPPFNLNSPTTTTTAVAQVMIILPNGVGTNPSLNFQPPAVTVVIGVNNTLEWVDQDPVPHTVTSLSGAPTPFDSKTLTKGNTFTFTFPVPGTYRYNCQFHPSYMQGTVIVKAAP